MYFIFALFLVLDSGNDSSWSIDDTEIFGRIRYEFFSVGPEGIYIKDFEAGTILHYDLDGKAKKNIGQQGSGPGEFGRAFHSQYFDGKVYAGGFIDQKMQIFKADGTFEKTLSLPVRGRFHRIKDGWVRMALPLPQSKKKVTVVYKHAEDFSGEPEEIIRFDFDFDGGFRRENGKMIVSVNPSPEFPRLVLAPDGVTGYLYKGTGEPKISVLNLETAEVVKEFPFPGGAIPFDEAWGEKKYEAYTSGSRTTFTYEKDFPDYFCLVEDMRIGPKGNLWILRGNRDDLKYKSVLCFSPDGKKINTPFKPELLKDMLGYDHKYVYFCDYDEDGDDPARILRREISRLK